MKNLSRRKLLLLMASIGGTTAVYNTAYALGLVAAPAQGAPLNLKPATGNKKKVLILGGGIAGLCCAYELEKAGYECTILDASHRVGGRNLTLRSGDLIDELGRPNYCKFDKDPNLYFNTGPARIPGHHRRLLGYCKTLGVPLHVRANESRLAYCHDTNAFGGKPIRIGQIISDTRGFMSELVEKGVKAGAFDKELSKEDIERLSGFSKMYGDLADTGIYQGTERAGSKRDRMLEHVETNDVLDFKEMLQSETWRSAVMASEPYDWAAPVMEPIGGMDQVVEGFKRAIKSPILLKAQVQSVQTTDSGVKISFQHEGQIKTLEADYCFNNIPAHLMNGIDNNLPSEYAQALGSIGRGHLFKIAFQMKKRFWEDEGIYGGISYTNQKVRQLWYPSHDINTEKGVMLGAYSWVDSEAMEIEAMDLEDRLSMAAAAGDKIHKNYSSYIEAGASVMWARMNHMMGCSARLPEGKEDEVLAILGKPVGRHFMIGDQVSRHSGWQEGALASAHNALAHFSNLVTELNA
ncbi:flavin monoamine oxidase family protein [Sessilibacter sp. MAH2]